MPHVRLGHVLVRGGCVGVRAVRCGQVWGFVRVERVHGLRCWKLFDDAGRELFDGVSAMSDRLLFQRKP